MLAVFWTPPLSFLPLVRLTTGGPWDDPMRHLPRYEEYDAANETDRAKIVWENVQQNPHIIAAWLAIRLKLFCKWVVKKHLVRRNYPI